MSVGKLPRRSVIATGVAGLASAVIGPAAAARQRVIEKGILAREIGTDFDLYLANFSHRRLKLIEVRAAYDGGTRPPTLPRRSGFTGFFESMLPVPEGVYRMTHPRLRNLDFYLQPAGAAGANYRIVAVFN